MFWQTNFTFDGDSGIPDIKLDRLSKVRSRYNFFKESKFVILQLIKYPIAGTSVNIENKGLSLQEK